MIDLTLKWLGRPIPAPACVVPATVRLHVHVSIDVPGIDGVAGLRIGADLVSKLPFDPPVSRLQLFGQVRGWKDCNCAQWICDAHGIVPIPFHVEREFDVTVEGDAAMDAFVAHMARIRDAIIAAHAVAVEWSAMQSERTLTLDAPEGIVVDDRAKRLIRLAAQQKEERHAAI